MHAGHNHEGCCSFCITKLISLGCAQGILMKSCMIMSNLMEGFRDVISYAGFTDLGFSGLPYTWDNRRDGRHNVKVRLD